MYRGAQLAVHFALVVPLLLYFSLVTGKSWHLSDQGKSFCQRWARRTSGILGLKLIQYGQPIAQSSLLVANHISFLDIVVIATSTPARFLSKNTVRYWPIIGFVTASSGNIFIKRNKHSELYKTKKLLSAALLEPRPLAIFPEGTTTLGNKVNNFHSGLFQAAIDANVCIQPVALRYMRDNELDRIAAYIDQDNFVLTLLRIISQPHTEVHLVYCPVVECHNRSRQQLASTSHAVITHTLNQQLAIENL